MTVRRAERRDVRADWWDYQHEIEETRVLAIIAHVQRVGHWDLPPVLVLEDEGNGYAVLDGHHRCEAACRMRRDADLLGRVLEDIPAYVLSIADYTAIVESEFGGSSPNRLADLRDYIDCDGVDGNAVAGNN